MLTLCFRSVQLKPMPTQSPHPTPRPYLLAFLQGLEELIRGTPQTLSYRLCVWGAVQGSLLLWEGALVSEPVWSQFSSAILLLLAISSNWTPYLMVPWTFLSMWVKDNMHFFSSLGLYEVFSQAWFKLILWQFLEISSVARGGGVERGSEHWSVNKGPKWVVNQN